MMGGLRAGLYPNLTSGQNSVISVIRDQDLATIVAEVATDNLISPRFGIFDGENGENGVPLTDIVEAGKAVFGKSRIFTPRVPEWLFYLVASAAEFTRNFGLPQVLDRSRVPELRNPNLATTNARLINEFPSIKEYQFQTFHKILADVAGLPTLSERHSGLA